MQVFRRSSSSQDEITDPLLDEEVDSQLQVELKSLMLAHENLGQQASSLGAELAQTRAEAEALKSQLEDATSRLTPSPTRPGTAFSPTNTPTSDVNNNNTILGASSGNNTNTLGAALTPSSSPALVLGSPFSEVVHEDILALQAQIELLTRDIQTKNDALKIMESARAADALHAQAESDRLRSLVTKTKKEAEIAETEAKHCIKQVQSGKEAALVAAATAASDAKVLATRCATLEVTVQRLMEGLENKEKVKLDMDHAMSNMKLSRNIDPNVLYSVSKPSATSLRLAGAAENFSALAATFNESSQLTQASDCEPNDMSTDSLAEGMDTASSGITGPVTFTGQDKGQEATHNFVGTIPAVHHSTDRTAASGTDTQGGTNSSHMSLVGTGRFFSNANTTSTTAPGTNNKKMFALDASALVVGKTKKKDTTQENEKKNAVVDVLVKCAAGVIVLAAVSTFVRGGKGNKSKASRSPQSGGSKTAATGAGVGSGAGLGRASSFVEA